MDWIEKNRKIILSGMLLFFLLIFLCFPNHNSSTDAYFYAASVKHGGQLFHPHHLLYNYAGWLLTPLVKIWEYDVLSLLKAMNAIAGTLCLSLLFQVLLAAGAQRKEALALLFFAGSCYGFMRYCTENEAYILPILFSLAGSLYLIRYFHAGSVSALLLAGFFAAVAVLLHQVHFIWWLGLLAGTLAWGRNLKAFLLFAGPFILVPVSYIAVFIEETGTFEWKGLFRYVLFEYFQGGAGLSLGVKSLLLGCINLVRSFVQIHGSLFYILKNNLLNLWFVVFVSGLILLAFTRTKPFRRHTVKKNHFPGFVHGGIFFFQFLFALLSSGNAEFMVMLPFLMVISLISWLRFNPLSVLFTAIALFTWNFSFGIYPWYRHRLNANEYFLERMKENNHALYIMKDDQELVARYYYETGNENLPGVLKAPAALEARGISPDSLRTIINRELSLGKEVYTDCLDRPQVIDRSFILDHTKNKDFFSVYRSQKVDSFRGFYGMYYLERLSVEP